MSNLWHVGTTLTLPALVWLNITSIGTCLLRGTGAYNTPVYMGEVASQLRERSLVFCANSLEWKYYVS
jgi:hypothetical protein